MSAPILKLDSLEPDERPYITIGSLAPDGAWQAFKARNFRFLLRWFPVHYRPGAPYSLRLGDELGLRQQVHLAKLVTEFHNIAISGQEISDAEMSRAETILDELVKLILEAPDSVRERLTYGQKVAILQAYPKVSEGFPRAVMAAPQDHLSARPTSGASSRASVPSTDSTTG